MPTGHTPGLGREGGGWEPPGHEGPGKVSRDSWEAGGQSADTSECPERPPREKCAEGPSGGEGGREYTRFLYSFLLFFVLLIFYHQQWLF